MTLYLTLYNDAKLKYGSDRNTESQRYQKLTCDTQEYAESQDYTLAMLNSI